MKYHSIQLRKEKLSRIKAGPPAPSASHVLRTSSRSMSLKAYCSEDHRFVGKRLLMVRNGVSRWRGL